jgi:hypothetical protein
VSRQPGRDVGGGVDPVDCVDVPRLDGTGVQRAAQAEQQHADQEAGEGRRGGVDDAGDQVQDGPGDDDGAAAEDVGEPARR